jgi:hypothetical protein
VEPRTDIFRVLIHFCLNLLESTVVSTELSRVFCSYFRLAIVQPGTTFRFILQYGAMKTYGGVDV